MNLEDILKKNYELYDKIFNKLLIASLISGLIYVIMKKLDILLINKITILIFGVILFITFGFVIYASRYMFHKTYNKIKLIKLNKNGLLDDINHELSHLTDEDFKTALRESFINTENYSIIFYRSLVILKFQDITRLFVAHSYRYGFENTIIELKNGKQYNISYYSYNYLKKVKKILKDKHIKVINKANPLYPIKLFFKTMIISGILLALLLILNNIFW